MTVKSYKLGPGTLTLGATPLDVSAQISNARVDWSESVTKGEDRDLLNGETLRGDENATYSAVLAGSLVQDPYAGGVLDYTWTHKGEEVPFSFEPSTAVGTTVTGVLVPVPLTFGGDAKTRPTADFTFRIIGDPDADFAAAV